MVPPKEIEQMQPDTLPADFGEWDSGEPTATQPASVTGFDASPKPPIVPVKARVAVSRAPVKVYAETEPVIQPVVAADLEDEGKDKRKKTVTIAAIGSLAFLLILGSLGYSRLHSAPSAPKPSVASQPALANTQPVNTNTNAAAVAPVTAPAATSPTQAATEQDRPLRAQSAMMDQQLTASSRIPHDLKMLAGSEAPPTAGFNAVGLDGMGNSNSVFNGQKKVKVEADKKVTVSAGITPGYLIQRTAPVYPAIARSSHISGTVVIQITVSKTGTILNPHVISGPTMLRQAALDAVRNWRYKPSLLNGEPVENETTVNLNFSLGQ